MLLDLVAYPNTPGKNINIPCMYILKRLQIGTLFLSLSKSWNLCLDKVLVGAVPGYIEGSRQPSKKSWQQKAPLTDTGGRWESLDFGWVKKKFFLFLCFSLSFAFYLFIHSVFVLLLFALGGRKGEGECGRQAGRQAEGFDHHITCMCARFCCKESNGVNAMVVHIRGRRNVAK